MQVGRIQKEAGHSHVSAHFNYQFRSHDCNVVASWIKVEPLMPDNLADFVHLSRGRAIANQYRKIFFKFSHQTTSGGQDIPLSNWKGS